MLKVPGRHAVQGVVVVRASDPGKHMEHSVLPSSANRAPGHPRHTTPCDTGLVELGVENVPAAHARHISCGSLGLGERHGFMSSLQTLFPRFASKLRGRVEKWIFPDFSKQPPTLSPQSPVLSHVFAFPLMTMDVEAMPAHSTCVLT